MIMLVVTNANAQAELDLRCPHMLEDTFSHGTTLMIIDNNTFDVIHYSLKSRHLWHFLNTVFIIVLL